MRILVISYSYAPATDPRALRWGSICERWAKLGHSVHVVTSQQLPSANVPATPGVEVHRVGGWRLASLRRWAKSAIAGSSEVVSGPVPKRKMTVRAVFAAGARGMGIVYNVIWRNIYWPDAACGWILPAFWRGRCLLKNAKVDVMVTVSHPFSGHVVGVLLKGLFARLHWVADSGDPFAFQEESPPNNFCIYRKLNRRIEKRVVRNAEYLCVTTDRTAEMYERILGASQSKLIVIGPMLQDGFIRHKVGRRYFNADAIVMLFVGIFYKDIRCPHGVLKLVERLAQASSILSERCSLYLANIVAEESHSVE